MKKILVVISLVLVAVIVIFGTLFLIDKNRMENNLPVVFSTWGYDYAPPEIHEDITNEVPEISGENLTVSIKLKENEDLLIDLLQGWTYEVSGEATEDYEYAIKFLNSENEHKATLFGYKNLFGVCGTELEIKDVTLDDGNIVSAGFYDGGKNWTFINFGNNVVMQRAIMMSEEESNEFLSMVKTMKFVKHLPGNIVATERTFVAAIVEEHNNYLIVKPDSKSIEANTMDSIKVLLNVSGDRDYLYGEGRKVIIKYNPIIQESIRNKIITAEDIILDGYLDYEITVVESEENKAKKILNNKEICDLNVDFDLYYYGLEEVNVKVDNKEMTLEEALRSGYITLEGMAKNARNAADETYKKYNEPESNKDFKMPSALQVYRDGGTIEVYYDDGGSSEWRNGKYVIIKCNTLMGNKDMYICKDGTTLPDLDI